MTDQPLRSELVTTIESWQRLVTFSPWLADETGQVLAGTPCAHAGGLPCQTLLDALPPHADSVGSGTCATGDPFLFLGTADGLRLGASAFDPARSRDVKAALGHWLQAASAQADLAGQTAHDDWSYRTLHGFYQALVDGTSDLQALLARAVAEAAGNLQASVIAVALLDDRLGTLELAAAHGAPHTAVRHFIEAYGPALDLHQPDGEAVFLSPVDGGWGSGWALPLAMPSRAGGLVLAWGEGAGQADWLQRLVRVGRHLAILACAARGEVDWQESLLGIFASVAAAIDAKAPYTNGQSGRTTLLALALADDLVPGELGRRDLRLAGLLHDIGNLGVPDAILAKAGSLTADELAQMRQHPVIAGRMLAEIPRLQAVRQAILHHHERWDGTGYPDRLQGEAIPMGARILAVADALIALLSPRPYREALSMSAALAEIRQGLGTQFDPKVGEALFRCLERNPGLIDSLTGVSASTAPRAERGEAAAKPLRLPVMPETMQRLHSLANLQPKPVGEVIGLLSADPALSARIMRYANSRRLGFARQITTVSQVVMLLGVDRVCNLALGFALYDSFQGNDPALNSGDFIGPHGLLTATGARMLCQALGQDAMEDEAFMAAMLHDVGQAILAQERPEAYAVVLERHAQGGDLIALERDRLGTDHATVGADAARGWGLPARLVEAIAWHHELERGPVGSLAAIVGVASELAGLAERQTAIARDDQVRLAAYLGLEATALDPVVRLFRGEANPILLTLRPERRR